MNKVKFKNGVELIIIAVYGSTMTFQNANRDTLEFRIAADKAEFEDLKAIYTDTEALSEIKITETTESDEPDTVPAEIEITENMDTENTDNGVSSLHLNYTLPVELGLKQIGGESVWCMKVAQKSELELAQAKQAADINDTQLALIELAELISGGDING